MLDVLPVVAVLLGHLLVGEAAVGERAGEQREQQAQTSGDAGRDVQRTVEGTLVGRVFVFLVEHRFQRQHGHHHHCHIGYDEAHGRGAEFIVVGQIVEQELVETEQVLSPRHKYCQESGDKQPPAFGTFHHEKSEHEEEHYYSAEIDRAAGERLVTPVEGGVFAAEVLVELRVVRHFLAAAATVESRHHDGEGFTFAVAPVVGVVDVQARFLASYRLGFAVLVKVFGRYRNLASATHGIFSIFLIYNKMS